MSDSNNSLNIYSVNVNGMNEVRKRRLIFKSLRKLKRSIILVQETHCSRRASSLWKFQWRNTILLTDDSSNTGGVALLFSDDLKPAIIEYTLPFLDRVIFCHFSINSEEFKVINVYMPTANYETQQLHVLSKIEELISGDEEATVILGGDFNVAVDGHLDRSGYVHSDIPNKSFRNRLVQFIDRVGLCDLWRVQNQRKPGFTWSRGSRMSRLDYLFISESVSGITVASSPKIVNYSDHRMISLAFKPSESKFGKGFWRFQTFLLERKDFCEELEAGIQDAITSASHLSPFLQWEFIKYKIRDTSINFFSKLKVESKKMEKILRLEMEELSDLMESDPTVRDRFHEVKRELFQVQLLCSKEAMIRSRIRWVGEGERPSKYFLNLQKKDFEDRCVSRMVTEEGVLLSSFEEILAYKKQFFTDQFKKRDNTASNEEVNFFPEDGLTLGREDKEILNRDISIEELELSLKSMKKGKAPGSDGIPPELYLRFWHILGKYLLDGLNDSIQRGLLSPNQRRSVITLIPKKGKDKRFIRSWRPISILNADYKVFSKLLSKRLAGLLPLLTNLNQTGFVKSRYIGNNVLNLQSVVEYLQRTGEEGLIVSLDFKSAFDSLDHAFMMDALKTYNLGDNFLHWVSTLYSSAEATVLSNGISSGWFSVERGVRQGCPLSPMLFVLAVERLADSMRNNNSIRGINVLDTNLKVSQFADDTTLILRDEQSIDEVWSVLESFKKVSGMELNVDKTKGLMIGDFSFSGEIANSFEWASEIPILGVSISTQQFPDKEYDLNFKSIIQKMQKVCDAWSGKNITLKGKCVILNTLVLPKIYYAATILAVPPKVYVLVDKLISNFLWKGKAAKISRHSLEMSTKDGGLGLHNFRDRIKTAKISWIRNMTSSHREPWHAWLEYCTGKPIYHLCLERNTLRIFRDTTPFFREVFRYWKQLYNSPPSTDMSVRNECLWGNPFVKGKIKKLTENVCKNRGIVKINDILREGKIMSKTQLEEKFHFTPSHTLLRRWNYNIPREWLDKILPISKDVKRHSLYVRDLKGTRTDIHLLSAKEMHQIFSKDKKTKVTFKEKWQKAYPEVELFKSNYQWEKWVLLPYMLTHEIQLQNFSFRILHRVLPCQVYLKQIRVSQSNLCTRCGETDDLLHFLFECPRVNAFWQSLFSWLEVFENSIEIPDLSEEYFLLGFVNSLEDISLLNYIFLYAKFYVYKNSLFNEGKVDLFEFLLELKFRLRIERACCFKDMSYEKRFKNWEDFYQKL